MSRRRYAVVAAALLLMATAAAAPTVEEAGDYVYPYVVDDLEGDHEGIGGAPNEGNPENDILGFDVTDDGDVLVMRFRMATLEFTVPGIAAVDVETTGPNGEAWHVQASYSSGGADMSTGDPDADQTTGDGDDLMPGVSAAADNANSIVYIFAKLDAIGIQDGGTIEFRAAGSGRGVGVGGVTGTFSGLDSVDIGGTSYTQQNGAVPAPPPGPDFAIHHEDLASGEDSRDLAGLNGTHDVYRYNFTNEAVNVTFSFDAVVENGSVAISLRTADGRTLLNNTVTQNRTDEVILTNQTAGAWNLSLNFTGYTGNFSFAFLPVPEDTGGGGTGSATQTTSSTSSARQSTTAGGSGNATAGGGEESPAVPLVLLTGSLAVLAALRRRW